MLSPKPRAIMDHCNTCLEANCRPGLNTGPTPTVLRIAMPSKIPKTGPPMIGTQRPNIMANTPTPRATPSRTREEGARGAARVGDPPPKKKPWGAEKTRKEEMADPRGDAGGGETILKSNW